MRWRKHWLHRKVKEGDEHFHCRIEKIIEGPPRCILFCTHPKQENNPEHFERRPTWLEFLSAFLTMPESCIVVGDEVEL